MVSLELDAEYIAMVTEFNYDKHFLLNAHIKSVFIKKFEPAIIWNYWHVLPCDVAYLCKNMKKSFVLWVSYDNDTHGSYVMPLAMSLSKHELKIYADLNIIKA